MAHKTKKSTVIISSPKNYILTQTIFTKKFKYTQSKKKLSRVSY